MSKQVRWQVPFVSRLGTAYRVDIYDEGYTGTPVQLTAGPTPFVTDEDASEDYFAPIRVQTGTLTVCTHDEDGNVLITLDDILPANNIARPVLLVNVGTGAIEWQGFLSCEAYDQDYTSIPQHLQLPVISVLEAMASVEVDPTKLSGLNTIVTTILQLLEIFINKAGVSYFSEYYVPTVARGRNILSKYIDATVLFEQKEYNNENSTTYIVSGLSLQDCLARIATYMGWCLREKSGTLYFMAANETVSYNRRYRIGMVDQQGNISYSWMNDFKETSVVARDIASLLWAGVDHRRTVSQGAKSVEVVAKIEQNNFSLSIPAFPFGNVSNLEWGNFIKYNSNTFKYIYIQLNYNENAYNNNSYGYYSGTLERTGDSDYTSSYIGKSTQSDFVGRLSLFPRYHLKYIGANPVITGAILIRYAISDEQTSTPELKEALYCPLLPGQNGRDIPIFKMWTLKRYAFFNGKFVIKADMLFNALSRYNSLNQQIMSDVVDNSLVACPNEKMTLAIKVGNKYWNGTAWTATRSGFQVTLKDNGINAEIAIGDYMSGDVTLEVWGGVTVGGNVNTLYEVIFNSLEVGFEFNQNYMDNEHSENHYFRLLGTNFRDEISISTEIASMLNNQPSPSLIMNSTTEAMTKLNYGSTQSPDMRRPEVDLLNRLATYYGAARQRIELEVEHQTDAPLPLLRLNGINDGKVYLPLAESRDWQSDVCKLTCFETPQ